MTQNMTKQEKQENYIHTTAKKERKNPLARYKKIFIGEKLQISININLFIYFFLTDL